MSGELTVTSTSIANVSNIKITAIAVGAHTRWRRFLLWRTLLISLLNALQRPMPMVSKAAILFIVWNLKSSAEIVSL